MIDTHCHLSINDYDNLEQVISDMENNIMIVSGADMQMNNEVLNLTQKYVNIYGTIGIHPSEIDEMTFQNLEFLEKHMADPKIVGIGEIGLDYYWDKEHKELQREYFIKQIQLGRKYNKPLVIHSREAIEETYEILKEYATGMKIVIHCFSGSLEMAKKFISIGCKLGIGGVVTFKNSKLPEVIKNLDLSNFVLETDSPYLAPEPYRGKQNEPKNIKIIAEKISEIKGISLDEVLNTTTSTSISQFDLN